METKMDHAAENREKRLKELRDKLKAKQEHAERVRRRKQLAPPKEDESPRQATPVPRITEETPVGISTSVTADHFRKSREQQFDDVPVGLNAGGMH